MSFNFRGLSYLGITNRHQPVERNVEMVDRMESGQLKRAVSTTVSSKSDSDNNNSSNKKVCCMSFWELMLVLKPYFWPNEGSDGAVINRLRSTLTVAFIFGSMLSKT